MDEVYAANPQTTADIQARATDIIQTPAFDIGRPRWDNA
jgi:hypothetical protein